MLKMSFLSQNDSKKVSNMFSLKQLRTFCTVVEAGTFRAAAEQLNVTQPPLSRQIQQLEESLGCQLFDRPDRRSELTATGRFFYEQSLGLLASSEHVVEQTRAYSRGLIGELRLGVTDDFVYSKVYRRVLKFMKDYPEVKVHTKLDTAMSLVRLLENNQLDLVLTNLPLKITRKRFETVTTEPTRLMVVVPKHHKWQRKRFIEVSTLHKQPLILLPDSSTAPFAVQYRKLFKAAGIEPASAPQSDSSDLQLQMVRHGVGIGILSEHAIPPNTTDLVAIPINHELALVQHGVVYNRELRSPSLETLIGTIRKN